VKLHTSDLVNRLSQVITCPSTTHYHQRERYQCHCATVISSVSLYAAGPLARVCLSRLSVTLVYSGQTVGWSKMPLGMEVGLGPCHIVQDGDPAPPQKGGHSPQFSAYDCCGQTAGSIKMPLGAKVCLGPDHIVLHEDPAHPKGAPPPIFG